MEQNPEIRCQSCPEWDWQFDVAAPVVPATKDTPCGYPVCDECYSWVMGRITCPFHGDDNCEHSWG